MKWERIITNMNDLPMSVGWKYNKFVIILDKYCNLYLFDRYRTSSSLTNINTMSGTMTVGHRYIYHSTMKNVIDYIKHLAYEHTK